ncbi:MAG: LacI family DNA-binding transcriptional regulator [Bacteroidales bacterium]
MTKKGEVTIYDISKALNISASTVSRGLNNSPQVRKELRRKIMLTAQEMGYQHNKFAANLRQKRTRTLGVIIPRIDSHFMSSVISGMEKVANNSGYQLLISQSEESANLEEANIQALFSSRVDGLLVSLSFETKNLDAFRNVFRRDMPLVFFDRVFECNNCVSVVIDNYRAGYEATMHLIDQGCRRIVHVGGSMNRNVYKDRYRGYRQALADRSLDYDDRMLILTNLSDDSGEVIIRQLLGNGTMPDGIFTANDTSAVSLICELKKKGYSVPEDVAVVGFNDDPVSRIVEPNLTTVHYPGRAMGEVAASTMIRILEGTQYEKVNSIILTHELIVRDSSLRAAKTAQP